MSSFDIQREYERRGRRWANATLIGASVLAIWPVMRTKVVNSTFFHQGQVDGSQHHPPTPGMPYVETGFPYGESEFISCAGSNWAAMALLSVLAKGRTIEQTRAKRPNFPDSAEPAKFGSLAEPGMLLDAGLDPNSTTKPGISLLMLSVNYVDRSDCYCRGARMSTQKR